MTFFIYLFYLFRAPPNNINGCITPLRDPESQYQAIKEILSNSNFANKIGGNARKEIINNYGVKQQNDDFSELFHFMHNKYNV